MGSGGESWIDPLGSLRTSYPHSLTQVRTPGEYLNTAFQVLHLGCDLSKASVGLGACGHEQTSRDAEGGDLAGYRLEGKENALGAWRLGSGLVTSGLRCSRSSAQVLCIGCDDGSFTYFLGQ